MNIKNKKAIGFRVSGDWGHFRRIDTTSVKQSYRIIPRTTIAGLSAAIIGKARNSYYDTFKPNNSAISVSIDNPTEIRRISELELTTNKNAMKSVKTDSIRKMIKPSSTDEDRQRNIYEWLKDPSYEIWMSLDDNEFYNDLKNHLKNNTTVYTPTLGKSECIAKLDYLGEADIRKSDTIPESVQSAVVADQVSLNKNVRIERVPYYNSKRDTGGRKLEGMISLAYPTENSDDSIVENTKGIYNISTDNIDKNVRFI